MLHARGSHIRGKNKPIRPRGRDGDKMSLYGQDENYDRRGTEYHKISAREFARCKRLY